jgi:hypothetical protein
MIRCDEARETLALQPSSEDAALQEHLEQCVACANYRRQHQALDVVLRAELYWQAPAALSASLLALASDPAQAPAIAPLRPGFDSAEQVDQPMLRRAQLTRLQPARPRPQSWYVTLVYVLTAAIVGLSLVVAWQFVGALALEVGIGTALTQLLAAPAQGLTQLTQVLPESRYVIAFFFKVRDQLMWLLLVAVLWAVLDKWNLQFSFRRPQIPS